MENTPGTKQDFLGTGRDSIGIWASQTPRNTGKTRVILPEAQNTHGPLKPFQKLTSNRLRDRLQGCQSPLCPEQTETGT